MTTTIVIIALLIIGVALFLLSDTITEALSEGKAFAPNELKPFK